MNRRPPRSASILVPTAFAFLLIFAPPVVHASEAWPGASWTNAVPESLGYDSAELSSAVNGLAGNVFVVKSGYVIAQKGDVGKKYALFSVGKSITALVFGTLLEQGVVQLDDTVPGSPDPSGPIGTYREFLAMCSDYGLTPHDPGNNHAYNNQAVHKYGEAMNIAHFPGQNPLSVLESSLYSITGRQDQIGFGGLWSGWGGGFDSSARDAARLGLILLRDGRWQAQQVVDASFIQLLYQNQIPSSSTASSSIGGSPTQGTPGNNWWNQFALTDILAGNYSFGWWTNAGGLYASIPNQTIWADGLNGHRIIVCPEKDLVVVVTYGGDEQSPQDILAPILNAETTPPPAGVVDGELRAWHDITVTFDGPMTNELATPNPFLDYRLDVTFTHSSGASLTAPGYYAADGDAAETSAAAGDKWRVHFMPDRPGAWTYVASFRTGSAAAVSSDPFSGNPTAFHGATGVIDVLDTDKSGDDFRARGLLRHVGERYLRFAETDEPFIKGGADSPENFLAFDGFDQTVSSHQYGPHAADWQAGDPDWQAGDGRNIIGALNYLASTGMNSVYFLTMNVNGDGHDVWPWAGSGKRLQYDCSKLDQWEVVFDHMTSRGLQLHVVTQETENDQLLDGGALGTTRALYYRELIARFGHHPALVWNLGEENTNTDAERKDYADFFELLDPYGHPVVIHTWPNGQDQVYDPLLGYPTFDGPSLQMGSVAQTHARTTQWIAESAAAGRPWFVCLDEIGPANDGVKPDAVDPAHDQVRHHGLWGNLMAGGAGVEWYFGYSWPNDDLDCEDWRSRDLMWRQTDHALRFFEQHLPFDEMVSADELTPATDDFVLAKAGEVYAIYLPTGGSPTLDFASSDEEFSILWYDPRNGGELRLGSLGSVLGFGAKSLGTPPTDPGLDWVVLVERATDTTPLYGSGVAGYQGAVPVIGATLPLLGSPDFRVGLAGARPDSLVFCAVGRSSMEAPFYAGTLYVDVATVGIFPFLTDGSGECGYTFSLPPSPGYAGLSLYFQWLMQEADAPMGVALSPGLQAILHD